MQRWELWDEWEWLDESKTVLRAYAVGETEQTETGLSFETAELEYRFLDSGRLELLKLVLERRGGSNGGELALPLSAKAIREFPIVALNAQVEMSVKAASVPSEEFGDLKKLRNEWPKGDVDKVARAVAHSYHAAAALNLPRQEIVQDRFGVSKATAGRMIAKARELGYIQVSSSVGRPKTKARNEDAPVETGDRPDRKR